jgi:hypothetical protein
MKFFKFTNIAWPRGYFLEVLRETDGLIGGMRGAAMRLGLPRTTLVYKPLTARPMRQLADEQCHATANC